MDKPFAAHVIVDATVPVRRRVSGLPGVSLSVGPAGSVFIEADTWDEIDALADRIKAVVASERSRPAPDAPTLGARIEVPA